jgi:hypothetical protein
MTPRSIAVYFSEMYDDSSLLAPTNEVEEDIEFVLGVDATPGDLERVHLLAQEPPACC